MEREGGIKICLKNGKKWTTHVIIYHAVKQTKPLSIFRSFLLPPLLTLDIEELTEIIVHYIFLFSTTANTIRHFAFFVNKKKIWISSKHKTCKASTSHIAQYTELICLACPWIYLFRPSRSKTISKTDNGDRKNERIKINGILGDFYRRIKNFYFLCGVLFLSQLNSLTRSLNGHKARQWLAFNSGYLTHTQNH